MPSEIYLVKVGMAMTEGMVAKWYVEDGGHVEQGDMLYVLETEKVDMDVDSDASGTVKHLLEPGVEVEPGTVIGFVFAEGEAIPADLGGIATGPAPEVVLEVDGSVREGATSQAPANEAHAFDAGPPPGVAQSGPRNASPIARRLAREHGLELGAVAGTGPGGRIVEQDVLAAASRQSAGTPAEQKSSQARAPRSSPAARQLARELGLDLAAVAGSGPGGRITREDVEAAAAAPAAAPAVVSVRAAELAGERLVPITGMRRTIAKRMHASLRNTAQLTMDMAVPMDDAVKLRSQLIDEWAPDLRPTYTDLVLVAAAKALRRNPLMNARFTEDGIVISNEINLGLAVALEEGLVVPVIRGADEQDLKTIAQESARLAAAARAGQLTMDDFAGGTFTVTSLGMYEVDSFTPILNEPQAGILGVNRLKEAVAFVDDRPVRQMQMTLSLTWDHRVLDGAPAAEFLRTVRDLLAAPFRLLV